MLELFLKQTRYEFNQGPNDAELLVYVPIETKPKNLRVNFGNVKEGEESHPTVTVLIMPGNKEVFHRKFSISFAANEATWTFSKKNANDVGDRVKLVGLSNADMNGKEAVYSRIYICLNSSYLQIIPLHLKISHPFSVAKPSKQAQSAGRVAVTLAGKVLSVKPENIENPLTYKKAAVVISLEKQVKRVIWASPPWDDKYEKVIRPGVTDVLDAKLERIEKYQKAQIAAAGANGQSVINSEPSMRRVKMPEEKGDSDKKLVFEPENASDAEAGADLVKVEGEKSSTSEEVGESSSGNSSDIAVEGGE